MCLYCWSTYMSFNLHVCTADLHNIYFEIHFYTIDLHACLFLSTCQYQWSTYMSVLIYISIPLIYMSVFSSYHALCSSGCQLEGRGDKQTRREGLKNKGDLKMAHRNLVTKLKKIYYLKIIWGEILCMARKLYS